ncbi:glycosyltransferase [Paenibacillus albidus]|uniref:glycosyltransferase n=1 Tax=Paenibacillus albidus TaxID=2041023 RepID=UPI001BE8CAF7|nr:glycosyltransferase [Paenibacillus albidus]MBT2291600.1 glycosyltransferase [Paenibacillus albidus]
MNMIDQHRVISKTNIIILTYNKLDYTQTCIESIKTYTKQGSYQIIVVDNCSTDGTREWLAEQSDILTIYNEENAGFPKGCNQGIKLTSSGDILLLNNDVIVTENWLDILQDCLHSSPEVGAVGPAHNGEMTTDYNTADGLWDFARSYNSYDSSKWENRLKLIGFAMLIKRSVLEEVGLLDERFSPGNCEDTDYSFRIIQRGYKILYCNNVFIHHYGSVSFGDMKEHYNALLEKNRRKFVDKWGFHSVLDSVVRNDLISLLDDRESSERFSALDVGCGCGATLSQLGNLYPKAKLYGIEKNAKAAAIAAEIANVTTGNVEDELHYPEQYFDYIFLGSVLEELVNPLETLTKLKKYLKQDGKIIASISNVMNYNVVYSLLQGNWPINNSDALNRSQLRFFTLANSLDLLTSSGFDNISYFPVERIMSTESSEWVNKLVDLTNVDKDQLLSSHYLFKVSNSSHEKLIEQKLLAITRGTEQETNLSGIISLIRNDELNCETLINIITSLDTDRQALFNYLASSFYKHELFNDIIPLLNASLEIDNTHQLTLFNYASILHQIGANDKALVFLNMIEEKDSESEQLLFKVNKLLNEDLV